jgi:hypothetical protein
MQPRRGYRDRVTTPGDEGRTELAWREIVENYGERPVLPDETPDRTGEGSGRGAGEAAVGSTPTTYDDRLDEHADDDPEERDELPAVDRFQPPAAPPFPRPRTWQRGLAWAGLFVAPVLALVVGLFSLGLPGLVGWALVAWFVGGFLYLVREMPRSPRDPWDDGSRI